MKKEEEPSVSTNNNNLKIYIYKMYTSHLLIQFNVNCLVEQRKVVKDCQPKESVEIVVYLIQEVRGISKW